MLSRTYGRIFLLQLCKAIEPPEEGLSFVLLCGPSSCIWGIYIGWQKKKTTKGSPDTYRQFRTFSCYLQGWKKGK